MLLMGLALGCLTIDRSLAFSKRRLPPPGVAVKMGGAGSKSEVTGLWQ